MDEREFQRVLERFPVVRKKTHVRVEWNSMYDSDDSSQRHPAPNNAASSLHQSAGISASDSTAVALRKFLEAYFPSPDALQIQREVEKAQRDFLAGLNLEDIDDMCAQFVKAT
ncbi:hypothetical protein P43SY_009446 [Pythium insidiosum]|uniref:Uncharacterized protein n=1 Tax=Pythium insidiosum TaxID=114742 RepID=A0AAD5Q7W8_PYTIN|nr:hypothetical protein P43SY_009446 [Pythium insidiosum]